jgi:phospholipid N-methyltransferase
VRDFLILFARFLRQPRTVGAVAPSSQVLAREMVRGLEIGGAARLVELGPGTGAFTGALLERLAPGGRLLAVELEPEFARQVQTRWPAAEAHTHFTAFQYVHAYALPPAIAFRRDLTSRFGPVCSRRIVVRNIPPAFVLRWTRT